MVGEPRVDADVDAEPVGDQLSRLSGADARRGEHDVRNESGPGQQPAQPFGLLASLLGERPKLVRPVPRLGIAGMRVTEQPQLHAQASGSASSVFVRRDLSGTLRERRDLGADLVAHAPEDRKPLLVRPGGRGRVLESPVEAHAPTWEDRARFARLVADRDHVVERLVEELADRLRACVRPVDADLGERPDGQRIDASRVRAGRADVERGPAEPAEDRFGHLAPRRVAGAHEQHPDRSGRIDHGLRSSCSPVARNTTSSAMFVTRSPIRSR